MAGLAFVLAVAAVLAYVADLPDKWLDRADKLSSVGSLVLGVAALLLGGMALRVAIHYEERRSASTDANQALRLDQAASKLADAVYRQWTYEAKLRHLRRPRPLRVRWSTTIRPVSAQPAAVLGEGAMPGRPTRLKLRGDLYGVITAFRQLPARQLIVLGEPGAGKTVLAMLFTLDLLDTRAPDEPAPVLLPLSSWNPHAEHLHTWLARRLIEDYPALTNTDAYGPDAATRLIHGKRLIPVLDGLDEMPPALHDAAIEALDRAVADGGPLVVTCRSDEYQSAVTKSGNILSRAAVVEIEPVDVTDSIEFLTATQPTGDTRWQPVFDHLRSCPDGPLAQALSTPLMVYLARIAYAHPATRPTELCDASHFTDRVIIEEHLLGAYLPSVYSNQPTPRLASDEPPTAALRSYSPDQAKLWLSFIARHLNEQQTHDLAWWRLHHALPRRVKKWVGGLVLGLIDGLVCAIAVGIGAGPGGFAAGLLGALIAGLVGGGIIIGPPVHPRQLNTQLRGRQRQISQELLAGITTGLGVGIACGIAAVITVGLTIGITVGITVGITIVIAVGVLVGLTQWLNAPADAIRSPSPTYVLRNDRIVSGMRTFLGVFGIGLTMGVTVAAVGDISVRITTGIVVGIVGGLVAGLAGGLAGRFALEKFSAGLASSAWGWSLVSRWWLALANKMPWQLMTFLSDAHRRGVLRQVGAVYQFRHTRLQDYLAKV